ncbi:MAG TPA: hypothetical protein VLG44_07010 [Chlamydiales bacterium]|nr:hypothetical protein [Chlamydiales bacterium]HSX13654.1 hypothetical protein [Chlamydiales bacterium]
MAKIIPTPNRIEITGLDGTLLATIPYSNGAWQIQANVASAYAKACPGDRFDVRISRFTDNQIDSTRVFSKQVTGKSSCYCCVEPDNSFKEELRKKVEEAATPPFKNSLPLDGKKASGLQQQPLLSPQTASLAGKSYGTSSMQSIPINRGAFPIPPLQHSPNENKGSIPKNFSSLLDTPRPRESQQTGSFQSDPTKLRGVRQHEQEVTPRSSSTLSNPGGMLGLVLEK